MLRDSSLPWNRCLHFEPVRTLAPRVLNRFGGAGSRYAANPGLTPIFGAVCRELAVCPRVCPTCTPCALLLPPKTVKHPGSTPPEETGRMNSSRTDGGGANGKRTNLVNTRGFRPAFGRNHPDVHCPLERHGREHLRGSNGNGTRRETGKDSPAGRAPELRGQSGSNGQPGKVSIPRRRLLVVSDIARSCLHTAAASWRQSSAHGFPKIGRASWGER